MSSPLDMDQIEKNLGAERRGKVVARGGYFGAIQLAAEVAARFRVPDGGGRPTEVFSDTLLRSVAKVQPL